MGSKSQIGNQPNVSSLVGGSNRPPFDPFVTTGTIYPRSGPVGHPSGPGGQRFGDNRNLDVKSGVPGPSLQIPQQSNRPPFRPQFSPNHREEKRLANLEGNPLLGPFPQGSPGHIRNVRPGPSLQIPQQSPPQQVLDNITDRFIGLSKPGTPGMIGGNQFRGNLPQGFPGNFERRFKGLFGQGFPFNKIGGNQFGQSAGFRQSNPFMNALANALSGGRS